MKEQNQKGKKKEIRTKKKWKGFKILFFLKEINLIWSIFTFLQKSFSLMKYSVRPYLCSWFYMISHFLSISFSILDEFLSVFI